MVIIENENIKLEIANRGAEIRRALYKGEDMLWNGDPEYWQGVAPVLFPICGAVRDNKFIIDGKEYNLEKHGFARHCDFELEASGKTFAVFLLKSNAETLKSYPWEFEFRIKYVIADKSVRITYDIKNLSDTPMYTAVGSHEAFLCPEGIEDYDIIFERKETLTSKLIKNTLLSGESKTILFESDTLPLYYKDFNEDALVFTDLKSRFVTLRNRKTGRNISVSFPECDYLVFWTIPTAKYLCIEPWTTCPSFVDDSYDITEKQGMKKVLPNQSFENTHIIYF